MQALRRPPKAVMLDFDGTLIDNSIVSASIERACDVIAAATAGLDRDQLLAANRQAWDQCWPAAEQRCWIGELDVHDVSRDVWTRALQACGCEDPRVAEFAFGTLREIDREMARLFDDVLPFLATVSDAGISTALVTNSSVRSQLARLEAVGLRSSFTTVVISGEVRVAKPDPAIFQVALDRLQLGASDVVHIGDSLTTDIAGAQAAGISSMWLNRSQRTRASDDPQPDFHIASLDEALPHLIPGHQPP